jgi:mRNA interferase MazF
MGERKLGVVVKRFEVFLVALDPTLGSEIQKTRPCVIISPDEINQFLKTAIIAPLTTKGKEYPTRVPCIFQEKDGFIVLDQIRTVDKQRLVKRLGVIDTETGHQILDILQQMFSL